MAADSRIHGFTDTVPCRWLQADGCCARIHGFTDSRINVYMHTYTPTHTYLNLAPQPPQARVSEASRARGRLQTCHAIRSRHQAIARLIVYRGLRQALRGEHNLQCHPGRCSLVRWGLLPPCVLCAVRWGLLLPAPTVDVLLRPMRVYVCAYMYIYIYMYVYAYVCITACIICWGFSGLRSMMMVNLTYTGAVIVGSPNKCHAGFISSLAG